MGSSEAASRSAPLSPSRLARTLCTAVGHAWSAPNTLLGLLGGLGGAFALDREHEAVTVRGGWLAGLNERLGFGGIALGDVVLSMRDLRRDARRVYSHELVHVTQARLLGPLYLPATLTGYALGAVRCPANPHDGSPLEVWADVASGNEEFNRYLLDRAKCRDGAGRDAPSP